jgi:MtN3 and saliva related transmembrane protein
MNMILITGSVAAALTTVAFLPQVVKTHRTRQTKDLSLVMYLLLACGLVLWTVYGFFLNALPVILANSVTLFLCGYILFLKIRHG